MFVVLCYVIIYIFFSVCNSCLYKEQEQHRLKLLEDVVASNKMIEELESGLLNRLTSTYRCIINDADFVCGLSETKVSNALAVE